MPDSQLLPVFLTSGWLSEVLGHEVVAFTTTRIGDGLVGMNLRLALTYGDPAAAAEGAPETVVAKLPSPDPTSRATGIALRNYEREVMFYRHLAPTLDIRVAACFHHDWDATTGDFVLLLEDLAPADQGNQLTGCSVDQARVAVLELARLHGPRWDDPTLADIEWLGPRSSAEDGAGLRELWKMLLPGFLATYAKYLAADALAVVEDFTDRLTDWVDGRDGPSTVTHGDYRLDNLMFASASGGHPIAVVDWQSPGHGPSMGDVSYFLGAGLLPPQRREVERGLVEQYGQALAGYGADVGADWLWRHYRRDAYSGVIMSVIASQIVGSSERSEALFAAMATRHTQHVLDVGAAALI
jgi:Phosphotransferase enzyme family